LSQVPDVTGQTAADAKTLLSASGFKASTVTTPVTDPSEDGLVVSQTPAGNSQAKKGTVVQITVGQLTAAPPPATTTTTTFPAQTTTTQTTTTETTTTTTTPASP